MAWVNHAESVSPASFMAEGVPTMPVVQAADLRQQALHAVQGDRRVQAQLGREISVGPGR